MHVPIPMSVYLSVCMSVCLYVAKQSKAKQSKAKQSNAMQCNAMQTKETKNTISIFLKINGNTQIKN